MTRDERRNKWTALIIDTEVRRKAEARRRKAATTLLPEQIMIPYVILVGKYSYCFGHIPNKPRTKTHIFEDSILALCSPTISYEDCVEDTGPFSTVKLCRSCGAQFLQRGWQPQAAVAPGEG